MKSSHFPHSTEIGYKKKHAQFTVLFFKILQCLLSYFFLCAWDTAANSYNFTKDSNFETILTSVIVADVWMIFAYLVVYNIPRSQKYIKGLILSEYIPHIILAACFLTYAQATPHDLHWGVVLGFYITHWLWYQFGKYICLMAARPFMGPKFQYYYTIPLNVEKYADRFGELFLILIGENFITIISEDLPWVINFHP